MVQQQFFAKDLSFPVNKECVLMGTSGNISKSFRVVGALGEGKWDMKRGENGPFTSNNRYLAGETSQTLLMVEEGRFRRTQKKLIQELGYFYRKSQHLKSMPISLVLGSIE